MIWRMKQKRQNLLRIGMKTIPQVPMQSLNQQKDRLFVSMFMTEKNVLKCEIECKWDRHP